MQIYNTVNNLFMILVFSVAGVALVLVGQDVGRNDWKTARLTCGRMLLIATVVGTLTGVAIFVAIDAILRVFAVSEEVKMLAAGCMRIFAAIAPLSALNNCYIGGIFSGGGRPTLGLMAEVTTMWGIGIPITSVCAVLLKMGLVESIFFATVQEFARVAICAWLYSRGKWMRNVTEE